ncbi:MAG: hypothetical protein QOC92_1120 [Acidimicrobiaceae bacterium]
MLEGVTGPVLDVGGLPGRLQGPVPGVKVVTANIEPPAEVVFDGRRLPFDDDSFDAATSIDVLEHLTPSERSGHLGELLRVARRRVVLCCPVGHPGAEATDRQQAEWFARLSGRRERYLDEHAANGLPFQAELDALAAEAPPAWNLTLWFHGDRRGTVRWFRLGALSHYRRRPGDRLRYAWLWLRTPIDRDLRAESGPHDNRAYLVARSAP